MTVRTDKVDGGDNPFTAQATFTSAVFSADDVLDIYASLLRPASTVEIDTAADASITVAINAYNVSYPIDSDDAQMHGIPSVDFSATPRTVISSHAPSYTVSNGESLTISGVPIKNIVITALTKGAGDGVSVKAR